MHRQPIIRCAEEPRLRHPSQARFFLGLSRPKRLNSPWFRNFPALLHAADPRLILNARFPTGAAGEFLPLVFAEGGRSLRPIDRLAVFALATFQPRAKRRESNLA
jgi:hypothetical protein